MADEENGGTIPPDSGGANSGSESPIQINLAEFSTKVGREFKSEEELFGHIQALSSRPEKLPEEKKLSPFVEKLQGLMDSSPEDPEGALQQFLYIQQADEKMARENPKEFIFRVMKNTPGNLYTDAELRKKIDLDFPQVGDEVEDETQRAARNSEILFRATDKAISLIPEAQKLKVKYEKPVSQQPDVTALMTAHNQVAEKFLSDFKEIKVGDYTHSVVFKDGDKPNASYEALKPIIQNPYTFISQFMNQDGTVNSEAILKAAYILNEHANITQGAITWGQSAANKENRDELENKPKPEDRGAGKSGGNQFKGSGSEKWQSFLDKQKQKT